MSHSDPDSARSAHQLFDSSPPSSAHPRKSSTVVVVFLIVGVSLLLGFLGHIHLRNQRRYLVRAVTHQINAHTANIIDLLSQVRGRTPSEIEDAVYKELQHPPSTSLITREMVSVRQSPEPVWVCVIDMTALGLQARQIPQASQP